MSLWFLLWFVLAFILIGATVWSTIILIQQKNAWRNFAKKKGLVFTPNKFFEPPSLEGVINGYNISFFSATQQNPDSRKDRQVTVMQVNVNDSFVDGIACGTEQMLPFLQTLEAITPHDVKQGKWNKKFHIRTRNKKAVDAYLTEERIKALQSVLNMPNADILIILDDAEGMFRFETPNPFNDESTVENTLKKLFARIKVLQPSEDEFKTLDQIPKDAPVVAEDAKKVEDEAEDVKAETVQPENQKENSEEKS